MGYGIVIWCDDRQIRHDAATGDDRAVQAVGRDLAAVLGADSYPTGGVPARRIGPFAAVGACAAHQRVHLLADGRGATVADVAGLGPIQPDDHEAGWVAQLTPGEMAARVRTALRSPGRYHRALARGRPLIDVLYGPNQVASASIASLWWFYADALAWGPLDPAELGGGVTSLIDTHLGGGVPVGRHLNALNKAGALLTDAPVRLVWAGNQLAREDNPKRGPLGRAARRQ